MVMQGQKMAAQKMEGITKSEHKDHGMQIIKGISANNNITIGRIFYLAGSKRAEMPAKSDDPWNEIRRYNEATESLISSLKELYDESGLAMALISIIEDEAFRNAIRGEILTHTVTAEYAVESVGGMFSKSLAAVRDEYTQARALDVKDVCDQLIGLLKEEGPGPDNMKEPAILAADSLNASELMRMDRSRILGIITRQGSPLSHVSILAGIWDIPAVSGLEIDESMNGKEAVVDGESGRIFVEPDIRTLSLYEKRYAGILMKREMLGRLKGREDITLSGQRVDILANIGNEGDLDQAVRNDARGVGLLRTEFLYSQAKDYPDELSQLLIYRRIARRIKDMPLIIRTLDIREDKRPAYFAPDREKEKEILRTQLRAILRASAFGNIKILYPMISSLKQLREIKETFESVKDELGGEGLDFKDIEQGIMVETPAAVLISMELAKEADFFSIGTNDLTRLTLAADESSPDISGMLKEGLETILEMIRTSISNAHLAGIKAGICGEMAGDLSLTERFVSMGVDMLSVPPARILELRDAVRRIE